MKEKVHFEPEAQRIAEVIVSKNLQNKWVNIPFSTFRWKLYVNVFGVATKLIKSPINNLN